MARSIRGVNRVLVTAAVVGTSAGCLTRPMWEEANRATVSYDHLSGTMAADGSPALLVQYGDGDDAQAFRVPLDPKGRPLPPFGWVGSRYDPSSSGGNVTAAQVNAVLSAATDARLSLPLPPVEVADKEASVPVGTGGLIAVAFRVEKGGHVRPVSIYADAGSVDPIQRGAFIALVPNDRPIAPDRRLGKQAAAVALTPVTAVGDAAIGVAAGVAAIAMAPIFLVLVLVNHKLILI